MYELRNLEFAYADRNVLRISSLDLSPGEIVAIIGENGSGKTTLLKLLSGILQENSGEMRFNKLGSGKTRIGALREQTVFVHQDPYLFAGTVGHNVGSGVSRLLDRKTKARMIRKNLELVGLAGFERRPVRRLSGGEKKRVALARALASDPDVLLLDEPTASVDSKTSARIVDILREIAPKSRALLFSTHNTALAYRLSDRLLMLQDGKVVEPEVNVYRGAVVKTDGSFSHFAAGNQVLKCPIMTGNFEAAVLEYDDVILSEHVVDTSAQNQFRGAVLSVSESDGKFTVCLDCGIEIRSHVTKRSVNKMNIRRGTSLYAVFKASSVQLY